MRDDEAGQAGSLSSRRLSRASSLRDSWASSRASTGSNTTATPWALNCIRLVRIVPVVLGSVRYEAWPVSHPLGTSNPT